MNFDIKDLKSWANRHDVGPLSVTGFFGNSLLEIDNEIRKYNKGEKDHLHLLYQIGDNGCFCFGYATYFADTGAFSGTSNFAFFLPLDAVKEDMPKEKRLKWRPCKDIEELEDLLNCDVLAFVGRVLELKDKSTGATIIVGITGTEELPIDSGSIYSIILGNGQVYSFADLFDKFEINVNDKWQPFGVKDCTGE